MVDVDHFKAFNDTHGHATGDDVLQLVGGAPQREFRRTDVPYRSGGEEFCVLLSDVTPGEAVSAGKRARLLAIPAEIYLRGYDLSTDMPAFSADWFAQGNQVGLAGGWHSNGDPQFLWSGMGGD